MPTATLAASVFMSSLGPTFGLTATQPQKSRPAPHVDGAAKQPPAPASTPSRKAGPNVPLLPGSGSKEPITITSDSLDFLNKDNKLIYTGHVVAVQGDSTLKASKLNIDLQKDAAAGAAATGPSSPADNASPMAGNSSVRHMEADGPVTMISKDQIGTGDHATYDKAENKVYLLGNVTLSQGPNVTQGDRLVYDMPSGQARVEGHVRSVMLPGDGSAGNASDGPPDKTKAR